MLVITLIDRDGLTDSPLAAMRGGLTPLLDAGMPVEQAIQTLRIFTAYLTGTVLREVGANDIVTGDPSRFASRVDELAHADPVLGGVANRIATIAHAAQFRFGVELFISAIDATTRKKT